MKTTHFFELIHVLRTKEQITHFATLTPIHQYNYISYKEMIIKLSLRHVAGLPLFVIQ